MQVLNGTEYIFVFSFGVLLKKMEQRGQNILIDSFWKNTHKEFPISPFSFGKEKNVRTLNSYQQG